MKCWACSRVASRRTLTQTLVIFCNLTLSEEMAGLKNVTINLRWLVFVGAKSAKVGAEKEGNEENREWV
jgi:hypothetical protein